MDNKLNKFKIMAINICIFQDNEIKTQVLKDHNRIFEDSKKVCEIGIVSKKCVCLWG